MPAARVAGDRGDHRLGWLHAANMLSIRFEASLQAEAFGEPALELVLGELSGFEPPELGERRGVLPEHALHRVLGSSPFPRQNSAKLSQTEVVSTPPKSISSPLWSAPHP